MQQRWKYVLPLNNVLGCRDRSRVGILEILFLWKCFLIKRDFLFVCAIGISKGEETREWHLLSFSLFYYSFISNFLVIIQSLRVEKNSCFCVVVEGNSARDEIKNVLCEIDKIFGC